MQFTLHEKCKVEVTHDPYDRKVVLCDGLPGRSQRILPFGMRTIRQGNSRSIHLRAGDTAYMYDWIIETASAVWKHGWSLTALGAAIFALLKQRKVKAQLRKVIPWLFADDSEMKQYVQNQQRIESKIDALLQREGIVWPNADLHGSTGRVRTKRIGSMSSSPGRSVVRFVVKCITYPIPKGRMKMNKLKSRKFWMSVISALLVLANDGLDLGLDTNTVLAFAGIVMSFIFGEAYVDGKKVKKDADTGYTNTFQSNR